MHQTRKFRLKRPFLALLIVMVIGLLAYTDSEAGKGGHAAHWGYEGEGGPEHWGEMKKEYAACSKGTSQSPIDISEPTGGKLSKINFDYKPTKLNILNNSPKPGIFFTSSGSTTSKVTSREPMPVPPVMMTISKNS